LEEIALFCPEKVRIDFLRPHKILQFLHSCKVTKFKSLTRRVDLSKKIERLLCSAPDIPPASKSEEALAWQLIGGTAIQPADPPTISHGSNQACAFIHVQNIHTILTESGKRGACIESFGSSALSTPLRQKELPGPAPTSIRDDAYGCTQMRIKYSACEERIAPARQFF
jgi:hypothetical protein